MLIDFPAGKGAMNASEVQALDLPLGVLVWREKVAQVSVTRSTRIDFDPDVAGRGRRIRSSSGFTFWSPGSPRSAATVLPSCLRARAAARLRWTPPGAAISPVLKQAPCLGMPSAPA